MAASDWDARKIAQSFVRYIGDEVVGDLYLAPEIHSIRVEEVCFYVVLSDARAFRVEVRPIAGSTWPLSE